MTHITFLTGTRADFGKIKTLVRESSKLFDYSIFATGMHMRQQYAKTIQEIAQSGFTVYPFINQEALTPPDRVLSRTIEGLSLFVRENRPDLLVIHGDRVETMAGAIVGNLNNILTAHIEGGELSGMTDGMMRHSITKLAHAHFCANEEADRRLIQLGERPETVFTIGSPDIDVMLSNDLPSLEEVKAQYKIAFENYGILIYHPTTLEDPGCISTILAAALDADYPFLCIYPNNDPGTKTVIEVLENYHSPSLQVFQNIQFEYFLTLMKHAHVILGNSSAGIREACVYGIPTVNVGCRQEGRAKLDSIVNVPVNHEAILTALEHLPKVEPSLAFGKGDSAVRFVKVLQSEQFWKIPTQKVFYDN